MLAKCRSVLILVSVAAIVSSCQDTPATDSADDAAFTPAEEASPETLPLKEIMRGLESDLADVAHGIWVEDAELVAAAAARIADHPRVTPEQMARIQAALAGEFSTFVQMDRRVHDAAVDLATAAESSHTISDLFGRFINIQHGCMSCHVIFRARVSEALAR